MYIHRACVKTATEELPVKNITPPIGPATSISYKTDAFSLPSNGYGIYSMFLCYYVAWPCDLDLCHFDLESVSCRPKVLLMSDPHTNFYYSMTIGYWVTSTKYLITFPLSEAVTAHAPCHVTSNLGKKSPQFWNPWPHFVYSLCHFHGATTNIKPCYRRKIATHYTTFMGWWWQ